MNYIITGIGKSQNAIFIELLSRQLPVKQVNYSKIETNDEDLVLVIYDGPQINKCREFINSHAVNVIPIFVDIDRIMIPGFFNQKEPKRICGECALVRMKEYYFPTKMHEVIISQENEFPDIYFISEEISLFCDHLITYINDASICDNIANFSFDYYNMIFKEISGYTNCPNCDFNDVNIEEMRSSLEGGKRYVSTNK